MKYLFTEFLLHFKALGYSEFGLGNAPLSGLDGRRDGTFTARLGPFAYRHERHFFNFVGLRNFKSKFGPRGEPLFVELPPHTNIVSVAKDVTLLVGGVLRDIVKKPR